MWRTAERRLVRHVCLRNPFPLFLLAVCSMQSLPEASRSWERKYQLCVIAASCPSLRCRKRRVSRREAEGLVTELWFPRFVTMQLLCSQSCYVTAANQWTIVEIELLTTVGWKCGCQPFSCRCTRNMTHCRKEICSTCLLKESLPVIPFGSSEHPVPTRSLTFLRAEACSASSALCLHHAHPCVAAAGKRCVLCREAEGLVAELFSPRFVTIQWLCSQLWYVTAANQRTFVELELLATVGWKCGCQPFSCPCSQNVTHSRKEIYATCLSKESIPAIPFGSLQHAVPTRILRSLRAAVRSSRSALFLHHAHAFVAAEGKHLSHVEKQRNWSQSCGHCLQELLQYSDCALSRAIWLLQTNEQSRDWAFSNSGLEVWLPAFQLPMFAKCDALRKKEICWTCSFKESVPAIPFWNPKHPLAARSRFLRAIPLLQRQEKDVAYAEKQRVWSRSFFLQDLLQCSDCALSCSMWLLQTNELLSRLSF